MAKEERQVIEKVLSMPPDKQSKTEAENVTNEKECIGRKARKWLFGHFFIAHDGVLNRFWNIRIMGQILAQSRGQVPYRDHISPAPRDFEPVAREDCSSSKLNSRCCSERLAVDHSRRAPADLSEHDM